MRHRTVNSTLRAWIRAGAFSLLVRLLVYISPADHRNHLSCKKPLFCNNQREVASESVPVPKLTPRRHFPACKSVKNKV
ncbi:hypothetical protein BDV38DRAFT_57825 [Aspergillus pseudotamarii]|uniref:Uncharacterized protein n=1 Tax=Aspergillus pseudotamarii TaxID=132259 RepID=A0A5N6SZ08_ASPPS|nr:uncharacterized protein BDV38DRAFT_57825 [Aspergillus pseudotamarii]KAE8139009.1 hypothetical protein BDV38DRAFT_57825 [Aspergillus pseudotamarii]